MPRQKKKVKKRMNKKRNLQRKDRVKIIMTKITNKVDKCSPKID